MLISSNSKLILRNSYTNFHSLNKQNLTRISLDKSELIKNNNILYQRTIERKI
jgi:hypothetical protein